MKKRIPELVLLLFIMIVGGIILVATLQSNQVVPAYKVTPNGFNVSSKSSFSDSLQVERININSASLEELQGLPRVGPVLAQRIMDYREQNGTFTTLDQLAEIKGIGDATLEKIRPFASVN